MAKPVRIGVVAPSSRMDPTVPAEVEALVRRLYPDGRVEVVFDPQCFLVHNHFAGDDDARAEGFLRVANDPAFDALWFARGGYGSNRPAAAILAGLTDAARDKIFMGYSDAGFVLAGLHRAGIRRPTPGPVAPHPPPAGGRAAHPPGPGRAWHGDGARAALGPRRQTGGKAAAFNITVLSQLLGTDLQPDLTGHELLLEDVGEYMYRLDRSLFHITGNAGVRRVAGIRLGRCSDIPENDPDFGMTEEAVCRQWCERSGIPYLGRADIGHDADNRIVPFGVS